MTLRRRSLRRGGGGGGGVHLQPCTPAHTHAEMDPSAERHKTGDRRHNLRRSDPQDSGWRYCGGGGGEAWVGRPPPLPPSRRCNDIRHGICDKNAVGTGTKLLARQWTPPPPPQQQREWQQRRAPQPEPQRDTRTAGTFAEGSPSRASLTRSVPRAPGDPAERGAACSESAAGCNARGERL